MHNQCYQFLNHLSDSASNNDGVTLLAAASGSDRPRESNYSSAGKQSRFRVTTAEEYPSKRRRM